MSKTVAVIDGNSLMHRAYHAVPPTMNAPDGTPTNACFGFIAMLLQVRGDERTRTPSCAPSMREARSAAWRLLSSTRRSARPMDDAPKVQFPARWKACSKR